MSEEINKVKFELRQYVVNRFETDYVGGFDKALKKLLDYVNDLEDENARLKDENFKLDYQKTRLKGALFEYEMNYYQDNLKESNAV